MHQCVTYGFPLRQPTIYHGVLHGSNWTYSLLRRQHPREANDDRKLLSCKKATLPPFPEQTLSRVNSGQTTPPP